MFRIFSHCFANDVSHVSQIQVLHFYCCFTRFTTFCNLPIQCFTRFRKKRDLQGFTNRFFVSKGLQGFRNGHWACSRLPVTVHSRASDSRPCRRRLWPPALLTLRLRVEAGQHPRTPPHRPRRSLRRPRPPCSLRPHCPFYPFSTKLEVWSLWWVVNVTLVPLASLYLAQDVVLKHFVVHSAKALKFLAIQDVTVDPGHWHDSDSVRLLLRQLICWARHRVATDAQVETADSGIAEPVTLVNGGR